VIPSLYHDFGGCVALSEGMQRYWLLLLPSSES